MAQAVIGAIGTLLPKLADLITKEYNLQRGLWAKAVRDLSYGLEDSIDKFMVRIETDGRPDKSHSFRNFIDKSLSLLTKGKICHKIGIDIKDIKSCIKEVSDRRDRYKVDNVAAAKPVGPAIDTLRLAALYRKATELVGTDEKSVEMYQNINEASWGEQQLISEIRTFFENKRYLIVIDDIWDKSAWENIKYALIENGYGTGGVYRLKPLSVVDSRKLFYQIIYEMENKSQPNQLVEVSERILKRCGVVPLAILAIGSLLSSEKGRAHTHEYWSKVYKSISSGLDNNHDDVKNMRRILSVSYSGLPPHLKTCLLHLGLYPEDYEIEAEQLIWKWVGEGSVKKEQGRILYEVGEDYLKELVNINLVQPSYLNSLRRVHDMVRDFITYLSREENFLTTPDCQQLEYLPSKIRQLSLQTRNEEVGNQLATVSLSYVRSLTVFTPAFSLLPALLCFPVLRVLDLAECEVYNTHWNDICNLFHLRYLNLRGTSITNIPKEIGNLQFLQVLDISAKIDVVHVLPVLPKYHTENIRRGGPSSSREHSTLSELVIQVEKPTQGREKRLTTGIAYPFSCLKMFSVKSDTMELRFGRGAMQSLQTLKLDFQDVEDTLFQFGDFALGLENLPSLEDVCVTFSEDTSEKISSVENALRKEIDMNQNKPRLRVTDMGRLMIENIISRQFGV
uniref:Putative disease resistance RPP8-like protein 2 n=1 Tax=Aegilops tauschii TaxID=37682 RepID=M8CCN2_AEGTA